jgi:hypothetical protein
VFDSGDWYWHADDPIAPDPDAEKPESLDDLWEDETVQEEGTHSVLDVFRIATPGEEAHGTVLVTSEEEAEFATGRTHPTLADAVDLVASLTEERWVGRVAVLHDQDGRPVSLVFWGISGD